MLQDSQKSVRFFEKTFLLTDINIKVVLGIRFLVLSNTNIEFTKLEKLMWRSYIIVEALFTTSRVKLIDKKEFAKEVLDKNSETFVIYISALKAMRIHLFREAQIAFL